VYDIFILVVTGDVKIETPRQEDELLNSDDEDNVIHEVVVPTCSYRLDVTLLLLLMMMIMTLLNNSPSLKTPKQGVYFNQGFLRTALLSILTFAVFFPIIK